MRLSDHGGSPYARQCQIEEVNIDITLSDGGGVCVCVCVRTKQDWGWWVSHPLASLKEEAKHCLVSAAAPSRLGRPLVCPFNPGWEPGPGENSRQSDSHSLRSANLAALTPAHPSALGRERTGCHPPSTQPGWGLPPTWRCLQKGSPLPAQTSHSVFCADFRQPRVEDTELYFPSSWKPLINVNWF